MNYLVKVKRQATGEITSQYVASDEVSRTIRDLFPPVATGLYLEIVPLDYRSEKMFGGALTQCAPEHGGPLKGMLRACQ